jgi:uncharacterized protein (TIGR00369 family)
MDWRPENLRAVIEEGIPFLRKLAITVEAIEPGRVQLRLPHDLTNDNYVGMTHAGAIFTFGETCAGAAAGAAFNLARLRMLARRADITYRRPVTGDLHGTAEVTPEAVAQVERAVERAGKASLAVPVRMESSAGEVVADMTVEYDFRKVA